MCGACSTLSAGCTPRQARHEGAHNLRAFVRPTAAHASTARGLTTPTRMMGGSSTAPASSTARMCMRARTHARAHSARCGGDHARMCGLQACVPSSRLPPPCPLSPRSGPGAHPWGWCSWSWGQQGRTRRLCRCRIPWCMRVRACGCGGGGFGWSTLSPMGRSPPRKAKSAPDGAGGSAAV